MLTCLVYVAHCSGRRLGWVFADHLSSEAWPGLGFFFNCIEPCSSRWNKFCSMKEGNQVRKRLGLVGADDLLWRRWFYH